MCFFSPPKPKMPKTPNEGEGAAAALRKLEIGPRMCYEHDYGYPHHEHLHCATCPPLINGENPLASCQKIPDRVSCHCRSWWCGAGH